MSFIKTADIIVNLDVIAEVERRTDGSIVILYIGDRASTVLPGEQANQLWEMLQRASRTPQEFMAGVPTERL